MKGKIILLMAMLALVFSCSKESPETGAYVCFSVLDNAMTQESTKAISVENETTLRSSGFNVSAVRGAEGADEQVDWFSNIRFQYVNLYKAFSGGRRWPSYDPVFRFYASNADLSYTAGGATVEARNTQDVVCAYHGTPVYEAVNALEFEHIFSLVSGMSLKWEPGYVLSDILITMTPRTGGTYNIFAGRGVTDGTVGWSNVVTATEPVKLFYFPDPDAVPVQGNPYNPEVSTPVKTNQMDLLLVPGEYEITAKWTATLRSGSLQHQKTYSSSKTTLLRAGDCYALSATLGGDGSMFVLEIERQPIVEWDASVRFGEWVHYNELWK